MNGIRRKRWIIKSRRIGKTIFDRIGSERIKINILQALPFWIASLTTGLIAVAYSKLFFLAENTLTDMLHWHRWSIFLIAPFCFIIAWMIVQLFAPNARGSGI